MHSYQSFAVIGGDLRQAHVANQLAAQGKTVYALLLETNEALHRTLICEKTPGEILTLCDAVVFPLPLTADDEFVSAPFSARRVRVADCLSVLRPGAAVFAGKISPEMHALAEQFDVEMIDYLEREELAVKNGGAAHRVIRFQMSDRWTWTHRTGADPHFAWNGSIRHGCCAQLWKPCGD